jgi:bile acid:Na+ symporter, BASS family
MDLLQLLLKASVVVFVVSSMLSIGLAAHGGEIVAPLRRPAWVLRALIANFVLAPAVALLMAAVLPLEPGYELGLLLLGFAAGAPFLPKVAAIGRTNVPTATALMVLLMAGSVVAMPLALPLFVKGLAVDPWGLAAPLVVLMLAPLLLGMAGQRFAPRAGARLLPRRRVSAGEGVHRRRDRHQCAVHAGSVVFAWRAQAPRSGVQPGQRGLSAYWC